MDHETISTNKINIDVDKENVKSIILVFDKKSIRRIKYPIIIRYEDGLFIEYNKSSS